MRLRSVNLIRYRQFVDETLLADPNVTVIVGRNDTGKTGLLRGFFDQPFYEGVIHSRDRPLVPGFRGDPIQFSLTWDVSGDDYTHSQLARALGPSVRTVQVDFHQDDPSGEELSYIVDGKRVSAYEMVAGRHALRKELEPRIIFPMPHYINVQVPIRSHFEARIFTLSGGAVEALRIRELIPIETLALRVAGLRAETRPVPGRGVEEDWPRPHNRPSTISVDEMDERLAGLSARITEKLQRWWLDPPGLRFRLRVAGDAAAKQYQHRLNSFGLVWDVVDESGLAYYGAGLHWFVGFLVELLYVEDQEAPLLLLFDEPATPLHPSAQRVVAKLLSSLAERHQVIYSIHSPFMIDWNFPQRLRLFERNYESKRTHIHNKPYNPAAPFQRMWDPLREGIGVTVGDVAVIGDTNLLVEGVTDQILLANAAAFLREKGLRHLDLEQTSIIPYGTERVLEQLFSTIQARGLRIVVLLDVDNQGAKVEGFCRRHGIPYVRLDAFVDRIGVDFAIEDVIGIDDYVSFVNDFYSAFGWFKALTTNEVRREVGGRSIGAFLTVLFEQRFAQDFSKASMAVFIVENIDRLSASAVERLHRLVGAIRSVG